MKDYRTLSDATNDVKRRGYTVDLNLQATCTTCPSYQLHLTPEKFTIDEFHRFEGMSNPSDNSIVYAISGSGIKGVFVDGYGIYSESLTGDLIDKLKINR